MSLAPKLRQLREGMDITVVWDDAGVQEPGWEQPHTIKTDNHLCKSTGTFLRIEHGQMLMAGMYGVYDREANAKWQFPVGCIRDLVIWKRAKRGAGKS